MENCLRCRRYLLVSSVNIQGGLFLGLIGKASLLVDRCDAVMG